MTYQPSCRFCGNHHGALCPMVKAYEYHPDGTLKRVEFWSRYELDNMAIKANHAMPVGTGTGSVSGVPKIKCARCNKEGHVYVSCPETIADNRRQPYGVMKDA